MYSRRTSFTSWDLFSSRQAAAESGCGEHVTQENIFVTQENIFVTQENIFDIARMLCKTA